MQLVAPADLAATADGAAVDIRAYGEDLMCIMSLGTCTGTTTTMDVIIEGSADGATGWSTLATFTQVTDASDDLTAEVSATVNTAATGYIRAGYTIAGSTPVFPTSIVALVVAEEQGTAVNSETAD